MKTLIIGIAAALLLATGVARAAEPCDRACLEGMLEDYLKALKAHDPSRLPLASDVRFTENNVPLEVGDGLWNTIDEVGSYRLPFIEPEAGQAGMFGVVVEHGHGAHLMLRLKVVGRKITEIETIVLRPAQNNGFGRPDDMKPRPQFYEDVPEAERLTRIQLASMGNAYFETLQQNNGTVYAQFGDDCHRIESGIATTNNPALNPTGRPDPGIKKLGCEAQFRTGYFRFVTHIRDRRFLIVDRQKGLVYAAAFFDHAGNIRSETLTDGRVVDPGYDTPWTWQIGEVFKIRGGKLHQIEALVMHAPYASQDVWSDHGHWQPAH